MMWTGFFKMLIDGFGGGRGVGGRCVVDIVTFCGSLVVDLTSKVNINRLFTPTAYGFVSLRIAERHAGRSIAHIWP